MVFDVSDPYYKIRFEGTSQALLMHHLAKEEGYRVERGYSEQHRFITVRSVALYYFHQYLMDPNDRFVGYLALTYFDRFLSRNNDIPVVMQGEGVDPNMRLFVMCCISIAYREALYVNFNPDEFVERHQVADHMNAMKMESLIREGLEERVDHITAFTPTRPLISLLEMEDQEEERLYYHVYLTLLAISQDIKFTKFRLSTLAASVILVVCYKLYPDLHHGFFDKILKSRFVIKAEVLGCFNELKDHSMVESVFSYAKNPRLSRENVAGAQGKGKEPLIEDQPNEYVTEEEKEHDDASDITKHEEDDMHTSEVVKEEEEDVDTSEISEIQQEPDEEEEETRFIQQMFGFRIC